MTLVLLHAFPLDSRMWAPQARIFDTITPEVLGIGSIDAAADHVARVLDERGIEKAVIGGLSRGGYIAMAFARRFPERLSALILCDTSASVDDEPTRKGRIQMAERLDREGIEFVPELMLPRLLGDTTWNERAELVEEVRKWILQQDPGAVAAASIGMAEREDARPILSAIQVPVLAIAGEEDAAHGATRSIAEHVRDGEFASIPHAGHLSNLEQPEAFNTAVREFLREHRL
jgi:pimeloyl-ACP methyl ester carboxylesterase